LVKLPDGFPSALDMVNLLHMLNHFALPFSVTVESINVASGLHTRPPCMKVLPAKLAITSQHPEAQLMQHKGALNWKHSHDRVSRATLVFVPRTAA